MKCSGCTAKAIDNSAEAPSNCGGHGFRIGGGVNLEDQAKPRWSMVFSHHPPSQYERTLHLGPIRLCARCTGLVLGISLGLLLLVMGFKADSFTTLLLGLATIVLGISAFVMNETGYRRSNNGERILFGILLGASLPLMWQHGFWFFSSLIVAIVIGQFVSAFLLQRFGVLDRFFDEYITGAIVSSTQPDPSVDQCGRIFCKCGTRGFRFDMINK